eukprot:1142653-Pelagomonas_calceolata.AAC.4
MCGRLGKERAFPSCLTCERTRGNINVYARGHVEGMYLTNFLIFKTSCITLQVAYLVFPCMAGGKFGCLACSTIPAKLKIAMRSEMKRGYKVLALLITTGSSQTQNSHEVGDETELQGVGLADHYRLQPNPLDAVRHSINTLSLLSTPWVLYTLG